VRQVLRVVLRSPCRFMERKKEGYMQLRSLDV
jgi:hypothetical protein